MTDKLTNKPVTPTKEMLEILKEWAAPDVSESKKATIVGKTNFLGVPIEELYKAKPQLIEPEPEEVPQLTAQEIEEIRQQAYEEGFAQGKADGFEKGQAEGVEQGLIEGQEQGHKDGFEAGLEQGQAEIQAKLANWQSLIDKLYNPVERVEKATEQQLLQLAVMLAEAVIRTEVKGNKESLLAALHESVAALPFNTEVVEIHMHPADLELVQAEYSEEQLAEQKWILKPEAHFNSGDVVVATPNSLIDRTVEQRIKQTLNQFIDDSNLNRELNPGPGLTQQGEVEQQTPVADSEVKTETGADLKTDTQVETRPEEIEGPSQELQENNDTALGKEAE